MNTVVKSVIKCGIGVLGGAFAVMKLAPIERRVVIMSRQSNKPSQDIEMLRDELENRNIDTVVMCKKMGDGLGGKVAYLGELGRQMKYLASSKVVVLDSYNIPVSLFKHRDKTKVIQMWHALGAMKKFSRSILDMPEGKSSELANLMKMHAGYDYIFTSSEASRPAFAEAFGYPEDKLTIMSLPRVDALLDEKRNAELAVQIKTEYPQLEDRETIVYAPTLRVGKDMSKFVSDLITAVNNCKFKFSLVIKMHPLTEISLDDNLPENIIIDNKFQTAEMFAIADYVITDYSAITYEVALKGLPIYFYAFDKDEYLDGRTFYLDYDKDMPGPICATADEVMAELTSGTKTEEYRKKAKAFADKYIEKQSGCTAEIADLIEELL
ncbi:MAG: CDP-glycerol glycerophosphotransferase family protein [Clostridiales bacterium]|nr:CDP-glycerol glycerophosphotransferase family protein [Candidatus Crickella equi]